MDIFSKLRADYNLIACITRNKQISTEDADSEVLLS